MHVPPPSPWRTHTLALAPFRDDDLRIYVGRARGALARRAAGLDTLDQDSSIELVVVLVPDDTWDVSSSFWLGMFGDSVRRLRPADFRARYQFRGPVSQSDIESGIEDALAEEYPLGKRW